MSKSVYTDSRGLSTGGHATSTSGLAPGWVVGS